MDSFIKLLRYRGHSFRRDRNNWSPHIVVKDVKFYFHLREVQKRIPPEKLYGSSTFIPTGMLLIKIGENYKAIEWKDANVKLENQLVKIVAKKSYLQKKNYYGEKNVEYTLFKELKRIKLGKNFKQEEKKN